jgi:hypothetical protein
VLLVRAPPGRGFAADANVDLMGLIGITLGGRTWCEPNEVAAPVSAEPGVDAARFVLGWLSAPAFARHG